MNIDPNELNDAARLRALADGEISRDEAGDVASEQARLDFENGLRESVRRVMGDEVRAPEALRQNILQMFADERASGAEGVSEVSAEAMPAEEAPGVVTTPMGNTSDRSFWSGALRWVPVAAVMALVVTLIGVGLSQTGGNPNATGFTPVQVSDVQSFVPKAHNFSGTCSVDEFKNKFQCETVKDAVGFVQTYLSGVPDNLAAKLQRVSDSGFEFLGMGACAVPGDGKSVHAYYRPKSGGETLSIFIQEADPLRLEGMCAKHCFCTKCGDDDSSGEDLLVWKCNGYLHYIYSPDPENVRLAREAFDAPSKTAPLRGSTAR